VLTHIPEFKARNDFRGMARKDPARRRDIERAAAPTPDTRFGKTRVIVRHNRINDDPAVLERAGRTLLRRTAMQAVLMTRGSRGMALFQPKQATIHVPIFGSDQVADVTGAGDTVIAAFALALATGASFYEAARLANYAGGLVVMKRGTATVSGRELADAIASDHATAPEPWSQEGPAQGRRRSIDGH